MISVLSFDLSFGIIGDVKTYQTLFWIVLSAAVFAEGQPFDRYQTIIDRKPFGPEPVNFDPEATPGSAAANVAAEGEMTAEQRTAEEQQLASNVRVSILNVSPAGVVKVGFTDSSANPAENYYLAVGASQNGWNVKSADPASESVTLVKDGVEVTVKLGETAGGGGKGGAAKQASARPAGNRLAGRRLAPLEAGRVSGPPQSLGGLARLRQRRMELAERERVDAARKREADAAAKAEREEREAREAEEKQRAAEERAQQREALLQIQEQLRKQREEREAARRAEQEDQGETNDAP